MANYTAKNVETDRQYIDASEKRCRLYKDVDVGYKRCRCRICQGTFRWPRMPRLKIGKKCCLIQRPRGENRNIYNLGL